jgi:uncharacterized protein (TIGR02266 family)
MSSVKVLLVDDVKLFIEFERSFFERAGCDVLTAASGEEALQIATAEKPHVVLLDYEMPGMMGDEVCRRLKEDSGTRHIPVLIVTSHHTEEVKRRCVSAGCTDLLGKPVSGRDLLEKVVRILEIPYRVHVRTRVQMEVSLGVGGDETTVSGYSEDISEGGLLVETLEPLEIGAKVNVSFTLPGQERPFETAAEVVRSARTRDGDRYAIGLRYEAPEKVLVEKLRGFVMQEVGQ